MATYTLISSVTVGSGGASTIDFTSIPATYTDLEILLCGRCTGGGNGVNVSFNSNTTGYTNSALQSSGSAIGSYGTYNRNVGLVTRAAETSDTFGSTKILIPNYAGSINKSYSSDSVAENNSTTAYSTLTGGLWSNTSAITSISLAPMDGSFVQHSTAYLYGISNA
jgi:hypothetical protein